MADLGRLGRELRSRLWRTPVDEEVRAELDFHLEMRAREYRQRGLSPERAREAARERLGDPEAVAAVCRRIGRQRDRKMRRTEFLSELGQDLKYATRRMRRSPLVSGLAAATLALGIGATTAIFSAVKAVILSPFPYEHPDRVVLVSETLRGGRGEVAPGNFADWRRSATSFEEIAALYFSSFNLAGEADPERVLGAEVTPSFFSVFGAAAVRGRTFSAEEEQPGRGNVVVLSHDLWARRFGAEPGMVGSEIRLNGVPHTIVGVMPPGFDPTLSDEQLWVPFTLGADRRSNYDEHFLNVVGLLRPGVAIDEADREMQGIAERQAERVPEFNRERSARVESLPGLIVSGYRTQLLVLLGAVFFILLIACANVANLLLAGGAARAKEIAVRAALGAGRGRVIRQLLTESLLISLLGGFVGVWLAYFGVRTVVAAAPAGIPRIGEAAVDPGVLMFALALSVVASLISGLVPAVRAARQNIEGALRDGRLTSAGGARERTRTGLVVAEVALAFVLVVGAGLLIRSVSHLNGLKLGFDPAKLVTARVTLTETAYPEAEQVVSTFARIPELLAARPGVESATVVSQAPLGPGGNENGLLPAGRSAEPENRIFARLRIVTPGYFETMGIPLLRGRAFTEADARGGERVMVVSEATAKAAWPGEDPIGKRIMCCEGTQEDPRWKRVVGVVGDVRSSGPAGGVQPEFYLPIEQVPVAAWSWNDRTMTIVARAAGRPQPLTGIIRSVVTEIDPTLPVYRVRTMAEDLRSALAGNRFHMVLLIILGSVGLGLAMVGVYGVISYFVSLRTSEIGLRMALGAAGFDVLRLLIRQGMAPVLAGLIIGLALALGATRLLQSSLFGVSPADPLSYAIVTALFLIVAILAILLPARRAARIDPTRALQVE